MKKYMLLPASLIASILLLSSCGDDLVSPENKLGSLTGTVVDFHTGEPLSNVSVYTSPSTQVIYTDASGNFEFKDIEAGEYSVFAKRGGYYSENILVKIFPQRITAAVLPIRSELSDNRFPDTPELLFPGYGVRIGTENVLLNWVCSDKDNDDMTFDIFLSTNPSPDNVIASSISKFDFRPKDLKDSTTYYWKVIAKDEHGAASESEIFKFTTDNYSPVVEKQDLMIFIDFEDGEIRDKSLNHMSVAVGDVKLVNKGGRNCGEFAGDMESRLRIPGGLLNTSGVFTAGCYVFMESNIGTGTNDMVDVLSRFGSAGVNAASWNLGIYKDRKLASQSYNSSTVGIITSPDEMQQNRWYHIAVVYNERVAKLYIDGILISQTNTIEPQNSDYDLHVGGRCNGYAHFRGYVDNVVFYARALSDAEIKAMAQ